MCYGAIFFAQEVYSKWSHIIHIYTATTKLGIIGTPILQVSVASLLNKFKPVITAIFISFI